MRKRRDDNNDKVLMAVFGAVLIFVLIQSTCAKAEDIIEMIKAEAIKQQFDPTIAIAVATVESSLNPKAIGKAGEIGLYQILPKVETSGADLHDTKTNIRIGIQHLKYWQRFCPTNEGIEFVNCYNSGFKHPKYPKLRPYVRKIASVMEKL